MTAALQSGSAFHGVYLLSCSRKVSGEFQIAMQDGNRHFTVDQLAKPGHNAIFSHACDNMNPNDIDINPFKP